MENEKKDKKNLKLALIIALVVIIAILCVFLFRACSDTGDNVLFATVTDEHVSDGLTDLNVDDVQRHLDEIVEEGLITISMNMAPEFPSGSSEGNLNIINETKNRYGQVVEILRDDTGESIYKTDMIPVGKCIEKDTLDVTLPRGTYPCTAYFHSVDAEGNLRGTACARIQIIVLS